MTSSGLLYILWSLTAGFRADTSVLQIKPNQNKQTERMTNKFICSDPVYNHAITKFTPSEQLNRTLADLKTKMYFDTNRVAIKSQ